MEWLTWFEPERLAACSYPRTEADWRALKDAGVTLLVNLHERPHDPRALAWLGGAETHLPVPDFTPPAPALLDAGVAAITAALAAGGRVAVHCAAGLGRTGTLLACYLVAVGEDAPTAIATVRAARPGSVETAAQVQAVRDFAARRRDGPPNV